MRCCTCVSSPWRQHLDNRRCTIDADPLRSVGHRDVRARMWVRDVIRPRRKHSQYFSATTGERKSAAVTSPAAFWTAKSWEIFHSKCSEQPDRRDTDDARHCNFSLCAAFQTFKGRRKHECEPKNTCTERNRSSVEFTICFLLSGNTNGREMWIFRCVVRTEMIFSFMNSVFKEHVRPQRTVTQKQTSLQLQ